VPPLEAAFRRRRVKMTACNGKEVHPEASGMVYFSSERIIYVCSNFKGLDCILLTFEMSHFLRL
jgi:hypothetical protein